MCTPGRSPWALSVSSDPVGAERRGGEAASRIVEEVSRVAGRVLGLWPGRCRIRAHDVVERRVARVGQGPGRVVSQAGFDGELDSRVLSLGRGRLRPYAPSEEVSARAA